ncbi:hypothetical protein C8J56DRAFT_928166 [Mycena floridula]|nr:hypothetical protein C8J56DRAFT_928166 [Mycena floridula]
MRLFTLVALFAVLTMALAAKRETNADRFSRGLPPLPPARRTTLARAAAPSGFPSNQCVIYCCPTRTFTEKELLTTVVAATVHLVCQVLEDVEDLLGIHLLPCLQKVECCGANGVGICKSVPL